MISDKRERQIDVWDTPGSKRKAVNDGLDAMLTKCDVRENQLYNNDDDDMINSCAGNNGLFSN